MDPIQNDDGMQAQEPMAPAAEPMQTEVPAEPAPMEAAPEIAPEAPAA